MGKTINLLIIVFFFLFDGIYAQDSLKVGRNFIPLPELSFNSDNGLKFAAEAQIYDYGYNSAQPFENYTRYRVSYSTVGAFSMLASNDDVNAFNSKQRIFYYAFIERKISDYFFGDTDLMDYDAAKYDTSSFYNFEMIRFDFGGVIRTLIYPSNKKRKAEFKRGIALIYEKPVNIEKTSFFETEKVDGRNGAFLTLIDLGIIIDHRNSEFRPDRGFFLDIGTRYSPPIISTYHGLTSYVELYNFTPLIQKKVNFSLATRLSFYNSIGTHPYWMTPSLGGTGTLRGFIFRRFSSDNAFSYSVELRSWFLQIPNSNIELGGQIFMDGGRVFSNNNWSDMLYDHKLTLGLGGVMSIFTSDFIMKAEIGFSEDGTGIYLGTGYSF